jgi:hypothetical protein
MSSDLSRVELVAELRAREAALIEMADEMLAIAEALWPPGDSERPADLEEAGVTGDELVAGIRSLHEYVDRVLNENYALRARIDGVPSVESLS